MLNKIKKIFGGLHCECGWYGQEYAKAIGINICECGCDIFIFIHFKIAKFIFSIYYSEDDISIYYSEDDIPF